MIEAAASLDAMLDVNLGGEPVFPVAAKLVDRGVPFLLFTGYSGRDIPARYAGAPLAEKPVDPDALANALARRMEAT